MRHYQWVDKLIFTVDSAVNTVFGSQSSSRPNPANQIMDNALLVFDECRRSQGLMRVNHSGEVCAQALYRGQLVFAKTPAVVEMLNRAAIEETDHLAWTHQRLDELNTRRSYLNFFWYINSFCIGMLVSRCGDAWSLGFVEETERQVAAHLSKHLHQLSSNDTRSQQIVMQMRVDEEAHRDHAIACGSVQLPKLVKRLMTLHAKVMTTLTYYF